MVDFLDVFVRDVEDEESHDNSTNSGDPIISTKEDPIYFVQNMPYSAPNENKSNSVYEVEGMITQCVSPLLKEKHGDSYLFFKYLNF